MTEDELRTIMAEHVRTGPGRVLREDFCDLCTQVWPCETYRLAKLALAGMQVVKAAEEAERWVRNVPFEGSLDVSFRLASALAEYEEATQ